MCLTEQQQLCGVFQPYPEGGPLGLHVHKIQVTRAL